MTEKTAPLKTATSFTVRQGQYLAFIDHYSRLHGVPPAESDFRAFFKVTPPVVHQMIKTLHARGFIGREPGRPARSHCGLVERSCRTSKRTPDSANRC